MREFTSRVATQLKTQIQTQFEAELIKVLLIDLVTIAVWNHSIHSELASETQVAPMVFGLYVQ